MTKIINPVSKAKSTSCLKNNKKKNIKPNAHQDKTLTFKISISTQSRKIKSLTKVIDKRSISF